MCEFRVYCFTYFSKLRLAAIAFSTATLVVAMGLLPNVLMAAPERYQIDPVHTQIHFKVSHAGFSDSTGVLLRPSGVLVFDAANWAAAQVDVRMQASNIEYHDTAWNKAMRGKRFFNVREFPELRFTASGFTPDKTGLNPEAGQSGTLQGELTVLGIRRPLTLKVVFNRQARHPYTLRQTLGFSARAQLNRSDFGMATAKNTIGNAVHIEIQLEAALIPKVGPSAGAVKK